MHRVCSLIKSESLPSAFWSAIIWIATSRKFLSGRRNRECISFWTTKQTYRYWRAQCDSSVSRNDIARIIYIWLICPRMYNTYHSRELFILLIASASVSSLVPVRNKDWIITQWQHALLFWAYHTRFQALQRWSRMANASTIYKKYITKRSLNGWRKLYDERTMHKNRLCQKAFHDWRHRSHTRLVSDLIVRFHHSLISFRYCARLKHWIAFYKLWKRTVMMFKYGFKNSDLDNSSSWHSTHGAKIWPED